MNNPTLSQVKQHYPVALYSFMRITHPLATMQQFLAADAEPPVFAYPNTLTAERAGRYLGALHEEQAAARDQSVRNFLEYRIAEASLLNAFVAHRTGLVSPAQLQEYRQGMEALYGPIRTEYFDGALTYLEHLATEKKDAAALATLSTIKYQAATLPMPSAALFGQYRAYMQRHVPRMFTKVPAETTVDTAVELALQDSGLAAKGWMVHIVPHGANVAVSRHRKRINIGADYRPATMFRLQQVIAHEVYGHARRCELGDLASSPREEEGVAIMYEQLLASRFMYKRMLRYIALGLAWGADGTPRDFVQTYSLMVPLVTLATGKTGVQARQVAFKETLRGFRGGNPSVPGMILLKDKLYFESNLQVWQYLGRAQPDEAAFGRLMDGTSVIPKEELA